MIAASRDRDCARVPGIPSRVFARASKHGESHRSRPWARFFCPCDRTTLGLHVRERLQPILAGNQANLLEDTLRSLLSSWFRRIAFESVLRGAKRDVQLMWALQRILWLFPLPSQQNSQVEKPVRQPPAPPPACPCFMCPCFTRCRRLALPDVRHAGLGIRKTVKKARYQRIALLAAAACASSSKYSIQSGIPCLPMPPYMAGARSHQTNQTRTIRTVKPLGEMRSFRMVSPHAHQTGRPPHHVGHMRTALSWQLRQILGVGLVTRMLP